MKKSCHILFPQPLMVVIPPESLRTFLALSYTELEEKNLELKRLQSSGKSPDFLREKVMKYLQDEPRLKAVTLAFCDIEGRMHMLDYDKKYFLSSYDNLTFDGSSIHGFSKLRQSDLRLMPDWGTFRFFPSDVFGPGKVLMFAFVNNEDGSPYASDFRSRLKELSDDLKKKHGYVVNMAPEIEGFLVEGVDAEQNYHSDKGFSLVTRGGYFNALPQDNLRKFIDTVAEVQRAMAFENEKDHGEVAPSQFEINFKYTDALTTCDEIMLYKLSARQVAKLMGYTATFLPKPIAGINGSGMHVNISIEKNGKNVFYSPKKNSLISELGERFVTGILYYAKDLCLTICPSVNAYRRLDPHYEAPNDIKWSGSDRSSMIRIPIGNEHSSRIEVRSVSPDANPYLATYVLVKSGLASMEASPAKYEEMARVAGRRPYRKLWSSLHDALGGYMRSSFMKSVLGPENHLKYGELKKAISERSPKQLGSIVKTAEIIYHHEVTNQMLWNNF